MKYLQEWNEACVYARECLPPFFYDLTKEPWSFMIVLASVCALIYMVNEL